MHDVRGSGTRGAAVHSLSCLADAPTHGKHFGEKVAVLDCSETRPNGRTGRLSRAADLELSAGSIMEGMRWARCRRATGNLAFKALKSINCYKFGRGNANLSRVLATLAVLAFLIG